MLETLVVVAAAGLGACVGSFLNVVIHRVPLRQGLGGRSHCPRCGAMIPWWRNLPVFGWLLWLGRASCCKSRIAVRYPLVELLTAAMFVWLAAAPPSAPTFGDLVAVDAGGERLRGAAVVAFACHAVFVSLLIANTFIDLDHRILPDVLTKPGMALGVIACGVAPGLAGFDLREEGSRMSPALASMLESGLGLLVGFGVVWLIRVAAGRLFRREAMGFGDVKFLGMIGAFLGWRGALLSLFVACLSGAVIGVLHRLLTREAMIPFGPFLALGAVASLFVQAPILTFLFETWPEWQRGSAAAPYVLLATSVLALSALIVLVRRGRGHG